MVLKLFNLIKESIKEVYLNYFLLSFSLKLLLVLKIILEWALNKGYFTYRVHFLIDLYFNKSTTF